MIKCPHCGSTAQIRVIKETVISRRTDGSIVLVTHYKCGCGTHFRTTIAYMQASDENIEEEHPFENRMD